MNRAPGQPKLRGILAGRTPRRVTAIALLLLALCTFLGVQILFAAPGTKPQAAASRPDSIPASFANPETVKLDSKPASSTKPSETGSFALLMRPGSGSG